MTLMRVKYFVQQKNESYFADGSSKKTGRLKMLLNYERARNKWTTLDSMMEDLSVSTPSLLNNKFYTLGGHNDTFV